MLEYNLEEEVLEEFKGGTLAINPDINKQSPNNENAIKPDNAGDNKNTNNNNNKWITSIPNKITETFSWNKRPKTEMETTKDKEIQQKICITEDPNNFFTFRDGVIAKALEECCDQFLDVEADGPLLEAFLLTQISNWNSDKERLLLLTPKTLVIAKYDFIALKRLGYRKFPLEIIDEVHHGDLIYPNISLIPHMNGLVDGISQVLEACLFAKWSKGDGKDLSFYQPRNRNMKGVRLVWNKDKPPNLGSQWNPFKDDLPFCTFTFHPLYFHKDSMDERLKNLYNLDLFVQKLNEVLAELPRNKLQNTELPACIFLEKEILLQNYVGLGSVIHNRNSLGFFKVRGKFSF